MKKYIASQSQGFSLIEILVSVILITVVLTTLVGLLSLGVQSGGRTNAQGVELMIVRNIEAKLLIDENWPVPASQPLSSDPASAFKTTLWFDVAGVETTSSNAVYVAELVISPCQQIPYTSSRLDSVLVSLYASSQMNRPLARFALQRAHLTPRVWMP